MPRALQISGMAVPLASSASASRSLRMTCSGEWRIRFIGSPPALKGENDSHIGWTSLRGAGQDRPVTIGISGATLTVLKPEGNEHVIYEHPANAIAVAAPLGMKARLYDGTILTVVEQ